MPKYDSETVRNRAIRRLSGVENWPDISAADFPRAMKAMRFEMERLDYVAMQSVALSVVACYDGEWPPMSPSEFSKVVLPGLKGDFHKFSDAVQMEEQ